MSNTTLWRIQRMLYVNEHNITENSPLIIAHLLIVDWICKRYLLFVIKVWNDFVVEKARTIRSMVNGKCASFTPTDHHDKQRGNPWSFLSRQPKRYWWEKSTQCLLNSSKSINETVLLYLFFFRNVKVSLQIAGSPFYNYQ